MATRRENQVGDNAAARSIALADKGVKTGEDFANLMSALMSDVLADRITAQTANAACNAGGKLLKVVEMQFKYGKSDEKRQDSLMLAPGK